jgi:cold shock CspA family protein
MQGTIVRFNQDRGFGFIYSDDIKRPVFFDISHFAGVKTPVVNQTVTFDLIPDYRPGHPDRATNVVAAAPLAGLEALKNGIQMTLESGTQVSVTGGAQ